MALTRSSDDVPWEALAAFLADELPEQEQYVVDRWLAEDPRHEKLLGVLRLGWQASAASRRRYDAEAALRWIKNQGEEPVAVRPRLRVPKLEVMVPQRVAVASRVLLAASAAALAVGGWWLTSRTMTRLTDSDSQPAALTEYHTSRGQRFTLKLSDGTSVMLGPVSRLRIGRGYAKAARAVELDGEAYFEVTHDATRPFSVRTSHVLVRDLGTRFIVQAHPDDRVTDVVVAEGIVAVGRPGAAGIAAPLSSDSLLLARGQRGRLTESGALMFTSQVHLDSYLGWTEGRLVFEETPLPEAMRQVSRWYDVRIRLADTDFAGRTLTATFRNEPVSEVLRLIAATFGLRVERDSSEFILRPAAK